MFVRFYVLVFANIHVVYIRIRDKKIDNDNWLAPINNKLQVHKTQNSCLQQPQIEMLKLPINVNIETLSTEL